MIHLRSLTTDGSDALQQEVFPFNVPVIRSFTRMDFSTPVTYFVGENGSGKSALLAALACAVGAITAGSESVKTDKTLEPARELARHFRLTWARRTHKGLFLRAEDFFGYIKHLAQMRAELESDLQGLNEDYRGRSAKALRYARMPYLNELHALKTRYGRGLENYSHGEGFLEFFQARFIPNGLYLLDEPEAPLSPQRQLTLLSLINKMVQSQQAQFIIATHSPLLLAYPGAVIYSFDHAPIQQVAYEDLEHVWLTRNFLNNPSTWLERLFTAQEE
jgi:predicted ATPase